MRKLCSKCQRKRDTKTFSFKDKTKGKLNVWCKDCYKTYDKIRYDSNGDRERKRSIIKRAAVRKRNMQNIWKYFEKHTCVDCPKNDPVVLTFDHLSDKEFNISNSVGSHSWKRIEKEIRKCEVRCANCHMRKTAKDFNWYKYL